jgi:hypothetical protein
VKPLNSADVIVAGSEIVANLLLLLRVVMAAAWGRGVSSLLLLLLPTVLAELRIAGAVEELDQGRTSVSSSLQSSAHCSG